MRFLEENAHQARVQEGMAIWQTLSGESNPNFVSSGQDIVEQLIVGLGWRVTAQVSFSHSPISFTHLNVGNSSPPVYSTQESVRAPSSSRPQIHAG